MRRQALFVFGNQACVPDDGLTAARRLGCETTVFGPKLACCMSEGLIDRFERVNLGRPDEVVARALRLHAVDPFDAVVAYDDQGVPLAARIAAALGLPGHPVDAADAARDKLLMKQRFEAAGVPIAPYVLAESEDDAVRWAERTGYPVVVKPVRGSASQGVIRADDEGGLREAYRRLRRIVRENRLDCGGRSDAAQLVESYLDGTEFSVELLVQGGTPAVICVFDKPRPLTGPFFEESIYVAPARLSPPRRQEIEDLAVRAVKALGLRDGMAHCELRATREKVYILEVGARLIGGACARVFRHVLDEDIHPYVLRLALGEDVELPTPRAGAAGAMMLPIPGEGRLRAIRGTEAAQRVEGIQDVILNTTPGEVILPFPEQSCYIGFLTARGESFEAVEAALVRAAELLEFDLDPLCCEKWTRPVTDHLSYEPPAEHRIGTLEGCADAAERVVPLVAATYFGEYPDEVGRTKARECVRWLEEGHRGETDPAWWLIAEGQGVALGSRQGEICFVSLLGVLPGHRGTGVGESLIRSVMGLFAQLGCREMQIVVEPRQPGNAAFFRSLGFGPVAANDQQCCSC